MTPFSSRLLATAVLLSFAAGCQTERPPAPPPGKAETRWHQLGTWSGRGDRQTESFEVTTGAMRLTWQTQNASSPGAGRLRISLHSAISGRSLQTIVDVRGVGGSTVSLEDDPRTSYLEIASDNIDWRVGLEEAIVTIPAGRP